MQELAANRVAIEKVEPELDGGRFAVKRMVGDVLRSRPTSSATATTRSRPASSYRAQEERDWREAPMRFVDNDRWAGCFPLTRNSRYRYTVEAWRDLFASWRAEVTKKHDAGRADRASS